MKLTGVELRPGGSVSPMLLSFRDPRRLQPYGVKKIIGLDADEIVNTSLQKRDIGFVIDLNPNYDTTSPSSLRDDIYRMIASTRSGVVEIGFLNGEDTVAVISGTISKLETDQFEKNQEVTLNISCTAGETLLKAPVPVDVDLEGVTPASTVITDLVSTAPHGFAFTIAFIGPTPSFRIEKADDPTSYFEVTPVGGFLADDILSFSSESNDKHALIIRGMDDIHLADVITRSEWPVIRHGVNTFECNNPTNLEWVSITHRPTYWGV